MTEKMTIENPLGTQPINKLIWKFSIPGIISQLVNSAHNIVDQAFLGWGVNDLAIGATNVAFPFTTIMTAISALIGMGAVSHFSILLGKKETENAAKYLGNAITLMIVFGFLIAVVASLFLKQILYLFGATDLIMEYAFPYARVICFGIPFGIFATAMSYFVRADGSPAYASAILLSGAIFNIVFDPIFLFLFNMGITGVALATVLGQVLSAILAALYLFRKMKTVAVDPKNFQIQRNVVCGIFAFGAAIFFNHILATFVQIVMMNAMRTYGALSVYGSEVVIAASGAVSKLAIVFLSSIIGIAIGCQPILGYNLGNKRYERVRKTYILAIRYGTTIAVAAFLLLQLFPGTLLKLFGSDDPLFYEFATRYIRIYFAMMFFNALQPVTSTFCTAIGKAKMGFWMTIVRQGILMLPLILILPLFFGIDGVLLAGSISDAVAAFIVIVIGYREVKQLKTLQDEVSL